MPEVASQEGRARAREAVLAGIPVTAHRMRIRGVDTAVLVGGDGPPMILLPGPGESALWWARVLPQLTEHYRVVAPDLPGTGESGQPSDGFGEDAMLAWLHALVERTCSQRPILVGHAVGGALAARYAVRHPDALSALVLVDTLGLRRFLPAPAFGFRLVRFVTAPSERSFEPFFDTCMHDGSAIRRGMGERWQPFVHDHVHAAQEKERKDAMGELVKRLGANRIPGLERIAVPTTLIWGRHDKATPLKVAQAASARYGWPLHVIDASGDDPKLERPEEFLKALRATLAQRGV